jgi:hypothetical protein
MIPCHLTLQHEKQNMACRQLPESIMKMVLEQVGKVLANDPSGRAQFVHSGGLAAVQQMGEAPGTALREAVEIINSNYPEEIVHYYSPGYSQQLLQKLDAMSASNSAVAVN